MFSLCFMLVSTSWNIYCKGDFFTAYTKEDALRELAIMNMADDFMFGKVMQDKDICRGVLSVLLDMDVGKLRDITTQDTIKLFYDGHGIRLDVRIVNAGNEIFNAEMQQTNRSIARRSRYYQSMMDIDILPPGNKNGYDTLTNCYILFICTFDPFGKGLHRYTFTNTCLEVPGLKLNDGTYKIFFYTDASADDVSDEVKELLYYFTHSTDTVANNTKSDMIKSIHEKVTYIRTDEAMGGEFMKLSMRFAEIKAEGKAEGIAEGKAEGIAEGKTVGKVIVYYYDMNLSVDEIAERTKLPVSRINEIIEANRN